MQKLSKYVKTHKLVSLGVVASAAALVATGVGTYSYFSDSKTANTNLTLNKGTVKLSDVNDPGWTYLGNTSNVEGSSTEESVTSASNYDIGQLSDLNTTPPYSGKYVNPDLKLGEKNVEDWSKVQTGNNFSQIVPGDTFRKKVTFTYSGSNAADLSMKLVWNHQSTENDNWTKFKKTFDYIVKYSVNNKDGVSLVTNISGLSLPKYSDITTTGVSLSDIQIKKDDTITIAYTIRMKTNDYNDIAQFGDLPQQVTTQNGKEIYDGIELTVKNHLEKK